MGNSAQNGEGEKMLWISETLSCGINFGFGQLVSPYACNTCS